MIKHLLDMTFLFKFLCNHQTFNSIFNIFLIFLQVSTSEELIKKECILAEEMLYKTITKIVIVSVPYHLGLCICFLFK